MAFLRELSKIYGLVNVFLSNKMVGKSTETKQTNSSIGTGQRLNHTPFTLDKKHHLASGFHLQQERAKIGIHRQVT